MIADGRPASEAFGPVHFVQQLEIADAPLPSGASGSVATALAQRATLRHTGTNLLGAIPLPVWLLNVHCQARVYFGGTLSTRAADANRTHDRIAAPTSVARTTRPPTPPTSFDLQRHPSARSTPPPPLLCADGRASGR